MIRAALAAPAAVALVAGVAQYAVGPAAALWLANASWTAAALFAVVGTAAAAARVPATAKRPWLFLVAASAVWLCGQVGWDVAHLVGDGPATPTPLDAGWLAFAALAAVGLYRLSPASPAVSRVARLETGALAIAVSALTVSLLWGRIEASVLGWPGTATAVAYGVLYVALAATLAQALVGAPRAAVSPALVLVAVGVALEAAAFAEWAPLLLAGTYAAGTHAIDLLWTLGMLAIGSGGLVAHASPAVAVATERDLRWRIVLPWASVLAVVGLQLAHVTGGAPVEARLALVSGLAAACLLLGVRAWFAGRLYHGLLGAARDAQAAAAASEERFALAVEATRDGIWDWHVADGERVGFSARWKEILGYAPHELRESTATFEALVHPDDLARVRDAIAEALTGGGRAYEDEFRMRHRDGSYRTIHSRAVVQRDARGRPVRMTGSHADVTELRAARAELERSNRELEAFAYTASHDLRAPLVSIEGFAGALARSLGDALDERSAHYLERIGANAVAMQRLIGDLLDYARAGVVDGAPATVDANAVAAEVVESVRARLNGDAAGVALASALPPVRAHRVLLKQALANLVENAVAHGRGPGPLAVTVSGAIVGDVAEIAVEDDGPGIEPDLRERMFELFERGLAARERVPDGTGVGLALVKKIAETSGGSLRYEDAAGGGARFVLALPKGATP